jgi:hypothetical protein
VAGRTATLAIKIVSDADKAGVGFDAAESRVARFERGMDRASVAAGGLLAGIGAAANEAYEAASALEQSSGAVETVYGRQAAAVQAYADEAAEANGLAARAYQESAALIGSQLKTLGFPMAQVADQTDGLIDKASDLAATFGGTTEDAVAALSSALKGERDPIERYGVSLSQAAIDAKVAALGLDTSSDASKRNAEAQAALALVSEQTAATQGAFARESDTAAGAQQRAAASFEDAKAALGDVLLPIVSDGMQKFADFTAKLVENKDTVIPLVTTLGGLAVGILAINGAIKAYRAVMVVATAAQAIFNFVMAANPIGIVVLAVAALVAGIIYAYNKFEGFRNVVKSVWEWLKKAFEFASNFTLIGQVAKLMGSPAAPAAAGGGGGQVAGVYGASGSVPGLFGASSSSLAGGGPSAGQGLTAGNTVVNITINGAIDTVGTGRAVDKALRDFYKSTGRATSVSFGRA